MVALRGRHRVDKRQHASKGRKTPKPFSELVGCLSLPSKLKPPDYADSTKGSIAQVWKRWTQFCRKMFLETNHFTTDDPVEVCNRHMHYEFIRVFLKFVCEEGRIGSASTLFTFGKAWRMGVLKHTSSPVDQVVKMDMKLTIIELIDEYELKKTGRVRKVFDKNDTFGLGYHFWVLNNDWYPEESQRLQHYIANVFCASTTARGGTLVESSGYCGHNEAVEYRDITLWVIPDEDYPHGVKLGMHIQLRLLKGRRNQGNPPIIKIVERRDTPSFCLVKFFLGLFFRDMAFNSPHIRDPMHLYSIKIPRRRTSVPIEWAPEWMYIPVLRRAVRDEAGNIVTSPELAAQYGQMAKWNKRLGHSWGMEDCLEFKILRRTAAAALSKTAPSHVRNQAMGHANSAIHDKYYQNDIVDADIVAAVLEKPSDEAAMRLLGHVSLALDPDAPSGLTEFDLRQVAAMPEVQEARARWTESTSALRHDYRTVQAARVRAKGEPALQARLETHDELHKQYKKIQAREERDLKERRRTEYFRTVGTRCLENQHTGQEEPAGPAPPVFEFSEREELARLLFPDPTARLSYDQHVDLSCRIIRLLTSLCTRRQCAPSPRSRRLAKDSSGKQNEGFDENADRAYDVEPCFLETAPELFPVLCPGTQCLFCLGNDQLSPEVRTYCFKNIYTLTRHVHKQHLDRLPPGSPIPCRHPHCQITGHKCGGVNDFKLHALQVHNIFHGAQRTA